VICTVSLAYEIVSSVIVALLGGKCERHAREYRHSILDLRVVFLIVLSYYSLIHSQCKWNTEYVDSPEYTLQVW
jgi:hypothetical protein